ncbi:unnamed protein product [Eretmochelys imbricata]
MGRSSDRHGHGSAGTLPLALPDPRPAGHEPGPGKVKGERKGANNQQPAVREPAH